MANSTADGSVVIDVNMDVSQAEKRLGKLRSDIKKTEKSVCLSLINADALVFRQIADFFQPVLDLLQLGFFCIPLCRLANAFLHKQIQGQLDLFGRPGLEAVQ